jgi:hypothetical protein
MTYPDIPAGRAQVPPSPRDEIAALRARVDELTRAGPPPVPATPVCRVKALDDVPLPASTDNFAGTHWQIGEDPDGLATIATASGTQSTITIAATGRYLLQVRAVVTALAAGATCAAFVTRGAATAGSSVLRDNRNVANAGGDGTIVASSRGVVLAAGDVLYWGSWASAAYTLSAVTLGVPSEVALYWLGTR